MAGTLFESPVQAKACYCWVTLTIMGYECDHSNQESDFALKGKISSAEVFTLRFLKRTPQYHSLFTHKTPGELTCVGVCFAAVYYPESLAP